jgi:hypothetical protein
MKCFTDMLSDKGYQSWFSQLPPSKLERLLVEQSVHGTSAGLKLNATAAKGDGHPAKYIQALNMSLTASSIWTLEFHAVNLRESGPQAARPSYGCNLLCFDYKLDRCWASALDSAWYVLPTSVYNALNAQRRRIITRAKSYARQYSRQSSSVIIYWAAQVLPSAYWQWIWRVGIPAMLAAMDWC